MKQAIILALATALTTAGISPANAQTRIRDLQPREDRIISISGVVRRVVGNEFIIDDGTGQVTVDAGPRRDSQINLSEGERVTIVGEYDDYDFDAYRITRANGQVIQIRNR
jgi:uncharacterized protein YdeI (BOF family)